MADTHSKLSVLVDPPLADPPPVEELRRRAKALRRRSAASRAGLGAVVAVVLIGAGIALVPGDEQTVQTAAPPDSAPPAVAVTEPAPATVAITTFSVDGQEWRMLATRTADRAICFTLRPASGDEVNPGCLTPDGRTLQAAAADLRSVSFVYGIVAPDATQVTLHADGNSSRLDVLGAGAGFPVSFVGTVVAPTVRAVELTATRDGNEQRVAVPLPSHVRVPAPTTTVTTAGSVSSAPARPPTTLAPDTPVSTVVPPTTPGTTTPPTGGTPKRVQPVPGATDLRQHAFESTAPAGAQAVAVRFWNGVEPCYVLGRVDVAETATSVTITLWTGVGPGAAGTPCIQMAGHYEVVVQLRAPLGTRTVVDGAA